MAKRIKLWLIPAVLKVTSILSIKSSLALADSSKLAFFTHAIWHHCQWHNPPLKLSVSTRAADQPSESDTPSTPSGHQWTYLPVCVIPILYTNDMHFLNSSSFFQGGIVWCRQPCQSKSSSVNCYLLAPLVTFRPHSNVLPGFSKRIIFILNIYKVLSCYTLSVWFGDLFMKSYLRNKLGYVTDFCRGKPSL